jgi:hypothetical protein
MARLPVPGSDDGTWGDVLNTFLTIAHNSDGTLRDASTIAGALQSSAVNAKGDLLVASAAATVGRLPVGGNGQVLTADSTQTGGVAWAAPAIVPAPQPVYPLAGYGFHSATLDIDTTNTESTLIGAFWSRVFVPAGSTIHALGTIVTIGGTLGAGGINGFAVYDDSGNLVGTTANNNSMWTTSGWVVKTLTTPIAAQSAGRFVYAVASCNGYSSSPQIRYLQNEGALTDGGGYLVTIRRSFFNSISSWPASVNTASYGTPGSGYIPLIALG